MSIKLANFFSTTLAADITAGATSFTVASTTGLPTLGVGDYFYLVLVRDSDGAKEIVKVTAWSTGSIDTCVRAQEGTTGLACVAGDTVKLAFTAATLTDAAAFPTLTITVGAGALSKTISVQASIAAYWRVRAWLIDGSTPTDQITLSPPDGEDLAQWEQLSDANGLATFDLAHTGASKSWYMCVEVAGKVAISGVITMGT